MSHLFKKSEETLGEKPNPNGNGNGNGNGQKAQKSDENHRQSSNEEEGHSQDEGGAVGFWSPELKSVRGKVIGKWAITTLIITTFIVAVLSLYWAVLFRVTNNMGALVVWVVDFDGLVEPYSNSGSTPLVGPQMVAASQKVNQMEGSLGWVVKDAGEFEFDPMRVRREVFHEHAWAAIIINPNATALLRAAVTTGNSTFDPLGIAQIIYVQARDETTHGNYITPALNSFVTEFTSMFGRQWASEVLGNATTDLNILQTTPQALSPAIGFSIFNLRPFEPAVTTPSVTIGLIYLIIISFFSFSFYLPIHMMFMKPSESSKKVLKFYQVIIWRIVATLTAYFILSLFYSLISLAFQVPFSAPRGSEVEVVHPATRYGRGSFVVYWMLNWVGMSALGLACENVGMVLGMPWTAFWLIFWVITNVSTSFYSQDLAPGFYSWGYAWPLHNIVEASRTILFDTHSRIGLNFGILFVWVAIDIVLFPVACWVLRWKSKKGKS